MPSQGTLLVACYFCVLFPASSTTGDNYQVGSPCSCTLRGRVYNLAPLASSNGYPKFEIDVKGWNFAYNPCIPFTVKAPECKDVAICRWKNEGTTYTALGKQSGVQCQLEEDEEELVFQVPNRWKNEGTTYTALGQQSGVQCQLEEDEEELVFQVPNRSSEKTRVLLKCNPKLKGLHDAQFLVINNDYYNPILQVEHNCCCPDACPLGEPLPTEPDIGKWIAVGISAIFACYILFRIIRCIQHYIQQRRAQGQEHQPLNDRNGPREN